MAKSKIIVNPSSGRQSAGSKIDRLVYLLHSNGHHVDISYTKYGGHARELAGAAKQQGFDMIIVSGGDGTVNEVVQGMMENQVHLPLAILSQGTVNDFAGYLGLPRHADEFFQMLVNGRTLHVDVGKWNERYFINVAAGGLLTEVAYEVDDDLKAIWGRAAYYMEGAKKIINELADPSDPFTLHIDSPDFQGEVKALLFMLSNTKSIGGFKLMAPDAEIHDGKFDVLVIKSQDFFNLGPLVINSIVGLHVKHKSVLYFKTDKLKLSSDRELAVDLDGERAGKLPAEFSVVPGALEIFIP